jgi:hypothetical protein
VSDMQSGVPRPKMLLRCHVRSRSLKAGLSSPPLHVRALHALQVAEVGPWTYTSTDKQTGFTIGYADALGLIGLTHDVDRL